MSQGAKIPVKYLIPSNRKQNFRKCPVCEKALRSCQNKSGLCSLDFERERHLNRLNQGFFAEYRERRKNENL